jgi:hypothetical protein
MCSCRNAVAGHAARRGWSRRLGLAALIALVFAAGCSRESEAYVRNKLIVILKDDLATVTNELPASSVADSTYFDVKVYKAYKEGKYTRMAVVDFYFLKGVNVKMVRKYRYHSQYRKWERYFNEYEFIHE